MIELKKIIYRYKFPANFDENDEEFRVFNDVVDEKSFKPQVIIKKNIRVANNSVAFNYFKIQRKSCIAIRNYRQYQSSCRFFKKFCLPKFNFSKKRFLLIADEWTSNYYHWHFFALQRLITLKNAGLLENSTLLLPEKYKTYPFALTSLKKFGIDENEIVYIPRQSNIKVKELAFAHVPQRHPQLACLLREEILKNSDDQDLGYGDKIYISRNKQKLRYVHNEEEFVKLLEKYGFKRIFAEDLSYEEQIQIMRRVKHVISPHGAGLTNILFMTEGANVLEICPEATTQKPSSDYCKLASMLDLNYFYYKGPSTTELKTTDDRHSAIFNIDLEKFEEILKKMLTENDK